MPDLWFYLLLLVPAVPLARDDFRTRQVAVVWLAALGVAAVAIGCLAYGVRPALLHAAVNAGLLLLLGGALAAWLSVRRRPLRDFFRESFGVGDAVFMLAVTPLFEPTAYVRFLLAANLAALAWWACKRPMTIPLAGFTALALVGYALSKTIGLWT